MDPKFTCARFLICVCVIFGITVGLRMTLIGTIEDCPGYENKILSVKDVKVTRVSKTESRLEGNFEVLEDVTGPLFLRITFYKFLKGKWMYFYRTQINDLCARLDEDGQLWTIFTKASNITSCPILKGEYKPRFLSFNLKSFNMKQLIGSYRSTVEISRKGSVIICLRGYAKVD